MSILPEPRSILTHSSPCPIFLRARTWLLSAAALVLLFLLMPSAKAELATPQEMEQVCQNWLTQMTHERGAWAGTADPEITQADEIRSDGVLLARYYSISPRGFVVVPVLKEMMPVKAYSDESILDERQEGGFLQLLREMLSERLELYAGIYGSLDAAQPKVGDAVIWSQPAIAVGSVH